MDPSRTNRKGQTMGLPAWDVSPLWGSGWHHAGKQLVSPKQGHFVLQFLPKVDHSGRNMHNEVLGPPILCDGRRLLPGGCGERGQVQRHTDTCWLPSPHAWWTGWAAGRTFQFEPRRCREDRSCISSESSEPSSRQDQSFHHDSCTGMGRELLSGHDG